MYSEEQIAHPTDRTLSDQAVGDLHGRVAIVTGSAQGIGAVLAGALAQSGAHVIIADRDEAGAARTADDLIAKGRSALAVQVDVSDEASVEALVAQTVDAFGRIDILVNNAAIFSTIKMKPFDEIDSDEWRRIIDVNLTGVFLCCRAVVAKMREQGYGRIINMSSGTVLFGRPNYLHYVASKAGVIGVTRGLARELGSFGITVNSILPGSVDTGIDRGSVTSDQVAKIIASQSMPRRVKSDDLIGALQFLASEGSAAVSGQSIVVDGGASFV